MNILDVLINVMQIIVPNRCYSKLTGVITFIHAVLIQDSNGQWINKNSTH